MKDFLYKFDPTLLVERFRFIIMQSIRFSKMKKLILLIFTLIIPASVFIFLKYFGTNTFEVPHLFENGIPGCSSSRSPHIVSDFAIIDSLQKSKTYQESEYIVFAVLDGKDIGQLRKLITQLIRIQDAFFEIEPPYFALLIKENLTDTLNLELIGDNMGMLKNNVRYFHPDDTLLYEFLKCQLAVIQNTTDDLTNVALVDGKKTIRGIYKGLDRQEIDKLILELKILRQ